MSYENVCLNTETGLIACVQYKNNGIQTGHVTSMLLYRFYNCRYGII